MNRHQHQNNTDVGIFNKNFKTAIIKIFQYELGKLEQPKVENLSKENGIYEEKPYGNIRILKIQSLKF